MALAYFTEAELRALPEVDDTVRYTSTRVTAVGEEVERIIEDFVGTSFVARSYTETHSGTEANRRGGWIELEQVYPIAVTSGSQNGVALTTQEVEDLWLEHRTLRRRATGSYTSFVSWESGFGNVEITYTAGYSTEPPASIKQAALRATRYRLLTTDGKSGVSDRATSITNDFGNVHLSTADEDHAFGIPEVDSVLLSWRRRLENVPGC